MDRTLLSFLLYPFCVMPPIVLQSIHLYRLY